MTKDRRTPSQYRLKGHKVSYATSGAEDGYYNARCTCGWYSRGWHYRKFQAVSEAVGHMHRIERDCLALAAFCGEPK